MTWPQNESGFKPADVRTCTTRPIARINTYRWSYDIPGMRLCHFVYTRYDASNEDDASREDATIITIAAVVVPDRAGVWRIGAQRATGSSNCLDCLLWARKVHYY